eukprot:SM000008S22367  [mRNA]  locus=s8:1207457:1209665:- [translate_table: standard]
MVLMKHRLGLDVQQRLVHAAQALAPRFGRPTTAGGRKYHLYSVCWRSRRDGSRFALDPEAARLPLWLVELAQSLAKEAHSLTPVTMGSTYDPDICLVNYYPVHAAELGVIGLGGHQDLDDTQAKPVVSVSIGDSMTFFFRRLPPLSRRKSGVMVKVTREAQSDSVDGDAAHNPEREILLQSGDVVVFGGESRLMYHGTRGVRPSTRPAGLRMAPGRLNFTFRQHDVLSAVLSPVLASAMPLARKGAGAEWLATFRHVQVDTGAAFSKHA